MSEAVVDSSVLLALIREEPFAPQTLDILEGAVMSTVNYVEVWTKLYELDLTESSMLRGSSRYLTELSLLHYRKRILPQAFGYPHAMPGSRLPTELVWPWLLD